MSINLTQSQICKAFGGIRKSTVNSWCKRGNMICIDGLIDITDPKNKDWIEQKKAKGKTFNLDLIDKKVIPPPKIEKGTTDKKEVKEVTVIKEVNNFYTEKQDIELAIKTENLRKIKLTNDKIEGLTVPTDEVDHILKFILSEIFQSYKSNNEKLLQIFKQRFEVGHQEYVKLLKELDYFCLQTYNTSVQNYESELDRVLNIYREVRGRGERK